MTSTEQQQPDYSNWSTSELIERVTALERQLKEQTAKCAPTRAVQATVENADCVGRGIPNRSSPNPTSPVRKPKNVRVNREFDPSKYSTRLIALKFAYLGQRYNGLEFHTNNKTPLPTVEEELWKALNKARLVFPTPNPEMESGKPNWEGCEYSKCGRTDKGVSAFGQVVGIRVRSNRRVSRAHTPTSAEDTELNGSSGAHLQFREEQLEAPALDPGASGAPCEIRTSLSTSTSTTSDDSAPPFHSINDEIQYCQILNNLLPSDIRMLAWCPAPPLDFSARFSCRERRYKYFFTQPAFTPTAGAEGLLDGTKGPTPVAGRRREGWLDIEAMRNAAHRFVGLHDFRNFCKVDPSKQIENFERRIFHADIQELDPLYDPVGYIGCAGFQQYEDLNPGWRLAPSIINGEPFTPKLYTFTLYGSAFLWHQVRHMVGILFLIGQGLESPTLVDELLDVQKTPCKPQYEMADDAPLVLWDCIFPREGSGSRDDTLEWIYVGSSKGPQNGSEKPGGARNKGRYGLGGVVDEMWRVWRGRKMDEVLAGALLDVIVDQGNRDRASADTEIEESAGSKHHSSQKVFQGGDGARLLGKYIPVLNKPRMESVEAINAKYAKRKGFEQTEEMKGFRRVAADLDGVAPA